MKSFRQHIIEEEEKNSYQLNSGMISKKSPIHGWGIFTSRDYKQGEKIYDLVHPCSLEGGSCRTEACRLTNHSDSPNIKLERQGNHLVGIANCDISKGTECTIDYHHVIPNLLQGNPINAGHVYRETEGIDHLFANEEDEDLTHSLQDIHDGKYKSLKISEQYIAEDDIHLSPAMSRKQGDGSYKEYEPRNIGVITSTSDKIKSFVHGGRKYHLFQSRDEDLTEKTFSIIHEDGRGKLKDVGEIGVVIGPGKQLVQHRIQTQLGRKPDAISLEPNFHSKHTGGGLVSKVYGMIARHHKVDLISDQYQTRGSQNLWNELARSGKVTGVHPYKHFEPFTYNPKDESHVDRIYNGGENALLHYPHEGRVIL